LIEVPCCKDNQEGRFVGKKDQEFFIKKDNAYRELNLLLGEVSKKLWPEDENALLKTEMLLFCIADTQIFSDITSRAAFQIQRGKL
jgi:hypothetical protein